MSLSEIRNILREWIRSSLVRRFAANSIWMTAARCCWILGAFTVGILVARKLGPRDYGIVNYCTAYVGMFAVIASLGVDSIVERDYILHPERRNRILGNYFLFRFTTTVIMFLFLAVSFLFMQDRDLIVFCSIAAAGYIFIPANVVSVVFYAEVRNEYNAFSQILTCFCYNGLRLWALLTDRPLFVYMIAEAFLIGFGALVSGIIYCRRCGNPLRWTGSFREACALLIPALPLSLTVVFSNIYARTDMLMLKYYEGSASVGFYSVAARFTENWLLFTGLFSSIFSVAVISGFKTSPEEYRKQLHRYYFMLFNIAIPPIVLTLLLGEPVIRFLYGTEYLKTVPVLCIFVFSLIFSSLLNGFNCHAINGNRLMTVASVFGSGAVINVPLNMILITRFGMNGAAVSSLISMPLGFIAVLLCTREGRSDLRFILHSLTHLPSFKLNA